MMTDSIPRLRTSAAPRQTRRDRFVTALSAAADSSLMHAVSRVVEHRVIPRGEDLQQLHDSVQAMLATQVMRAPDAFFDFVDALERPTTGVEAVARSSTRRRIAGGRVFSRALPSTYKDHHEVGQPSHGEVPDNDILFEHWVHEQEAARATVVILHGFAMGWPLLDARIMSAVKWYELGLDVVLLTLPDHGPRRPKGAVFSGQNYTVPHALRLAAAVRQAVHEIFEIKRWLRLRGSQPVGLVGMSLGGYLASLCAGLSQDFEFVIPIVPPACMGDLGWRVYRETTHHKAGLQPLLTEGDLRAAFYIHSPLAHALRVERGRLMIVAGAGDRIVPPEHPSAIWEHWGKPSIHWLRGSHMAPVGNRQLNTLIANHLYSIDIL